VINVEEWAGDQKTARAEGMGIKAIARRLWCGAQHRSVGTFAAEDARDTSGRDAARRWTASSRLSGGCWRRRRTCPPPVVAERIGCDAGITVLRERVG